MARERPDCDGLRLQVYAGRDPLTGRNRWVSRLVPGKGRAALKRAKQVEAELLGRAAGQHRRSRLTTVAELIERWLEGRQSVRPISPTTAAVYRGAIDRPLHLPSLAKVQVAASWSRHSGHLLRPPAPVGGRAGRPLAPS